MIQLSNRATALDLLRLSILGGLNPPTPVPFDAWHIRQRALRDYQEAMILRAADYMRAGVRRVLLQKPTGAGKTVAAAAMHASASALGMRSAFLVHRKELIDQTSRTFTAFGVKHGFVAAGRPYDPDAQVVIAGIQTLANRIDALGDRDLIIADECHHAISGTWTRVLSAYPEAFQIGLTATPERLDGKGLNDHFDVMIEGPPVASLIAQGYLSQFDYYAPSVPDTQGVHTVAGDFNRGEIAELMDKPKLIGDVVEHYLKLAPEQQGIVFAASREHSRHMAETFTGNGVCAAHVDGSMHDKERTRLVDAFRAGDINILSNCELFGEGFDVPGIVYVGLARPTKSLALHLQQVGRALRVLPGKRTAIIADHAGNALRHGLPDDPRQWSLRGREARTRSSTANDALPVRQCKQCFRVSPSTVTECPGCGEVFPIVVRRLETEDGELTKVERPQKQEEARIGRRIEERMCKTPEDFRRLAEKRGYAPGWAKVRWKLRHGGRI